MLLCLLLSVFGERESPERLERTREHVKMRERSKFWSFLMEDLLRRGTRGHSSSDQASAGSARQV